MGKKTNNNKYDSLRLKMLITLISITQISTAVLSPEVNLTNRSLIITLDLTVHYSLLYPYGNNRWFIQCILFGWIKFPFLLISIPTLRLLNFYSVRTVDHLTAGVCTVYNWSLINNQQREQSMAFTAWRKHTYPRKLAVKTPLCKQTVFIIYLPNMISAGTSTGTAINKDASTTIPILFSYQVHLPWWLAFYAN